MNKTEKLKTTMETKVYFTPNSLWDGSSISRTLIIKTIQKMRDAGEIVLISKGKTSFADLYCIKGMEAKSYISAASRVESMTSSMQKRYKKGVLTYSEASFEMGLSEGEVKELIKRVELKDLKIESIANYVEYKLWME